MAAVLTLLITPGKEDTGRKTERSNEEKKVLAEEERKARGDKAKGGRKKKDGEGKMRRRMKKVKI